MLLFPAYYIYIYTAEIRAVYEKSLGPDEITMMIDEIFAGPFTRVSRRLSLSLSTDLPLLSGYFLSNWYGMCTVKACNIHTYTFDGHDTYLLPMCFLTTRLPN